VQRLFRAQDRQRAVQAAGIDFAVGLQHGWDSSGGGRRTPANQGRRF
jgi:hypothetical protein